jgi:pseudouridine-5'-phosphate glycosidase
MPHELLHFSQEVLDAKDAPIVVLESTIISHGMPYPDNLATAKAVENIIRKAGAVPATIALHQGKIHVGIDDHIMELLAHDKNSLKASRRDMAFVLSQNLTASTTVAATMFCAHLAGFPLFVTGGIGGVHNQVGENFDISADLIELACTPVTVICSGAKSILDLPKTLEMLETHGLAVVGFGTDEFPAFYSHSSGIPLLHRLDTAKEVAHLMHYQRRLTINNGLVIANPIPKSAEIPDTQILPIIEQAQKDAKNINSKAITPFLLQRIAELTSGQSLLANIELIKNNALLGAQIAIEYNRTKYNSERS